MTIETTAIDAPAYWASYLINGDASSFSIEPGTRGEAELRMASNFEDAQAAEGWRIVDCSQESHFARFHFAGRGWLLCDLLTYTLIRETK